MRDFVTKHIDHITLVVTLCATVIYVIAFLSLSGFDSDALLSKSVTFALTAGALVSSTLALVIVATQPKSWFGNVAPYRFHLGFGCLIASIATISQLIKALLEIGHG